MKKLILFVLVIVSSVNLYAASYKDNQYQKLAEAYAVKAQTAFDEGEYDLAVEYTRQAEENAALSQQYVEMMLLRADADTQIRVAANRLVWARSIKADVNHADIYNEGVRLLEEARTAFEAEDYVKAKELALASMEALKALPEDTSGTFPEYYVVESWSTTRDCFWNIAGKPFVYNDPWLWKHLYDANKDALNAPDNPDLISPGVKIRIPSISGETRSGTYDPAKEYDTFKK